MDKRPIILAPFLLFLCSIPFGEFSPIPHLKWLSLTKIGFFLFLGYLGFEFIRGWRPPWNPVLVIPLLFFLGGALLATLLSSDKGISFPYFFRFLALAALSAVTGWMMEEKGGGKKIFRTLLIIALILSILGIYQTLSGKTIWDLGIYGAFGRMIAIFCPTAEGGISVVRASAAFDHPNLFATFLIAVLPFALVGLFRRRERPGRKIFFSATIVICLIALLFTFSRSAWLGLFAGLLVMFLARRGSWILKAVGLGVMAFALSFVLLPLGGRIIFWERTGAFPLISWQRRLTREKGKLPIGPVRIIQPYEVHRLYSYRAAWRMLYRNPLSGVGPGMFDPLYNHYKNPGEPLRQSSRHAMDAHNTFLSLGSGGGLLTLLPFLYLIGVTLLSLGRLLIAAGGGDIKDSFSSPVSAPALALAIGAGLTGLLVQSFFNSLEYQEIFWILIGAGLTVSRSNRTGLLKGEKQTNFLTP